MGRLVTCKGQFVWKYAFGEQASEICRIPEEIGVGEYSVIAYEYDKPEVDGEFPWKKVNPEIEEFEADVVEIDRADIPRLKEYLSAIDGDLFDEMVKTFVEFMESHEGERFQFVGEF